jgi:methyl-accepting chemotaxis protein
VRFTFRQKVVAPALVGALATLAATGASVALSGRAAAELDAVEQVHFPALQLAQDLAATAALVQRQLQEGGAAADATALEIGDGMQEALLEMVASAGPGRPAPGRAAELRAALSTWYAAERAAAAARVEGAAPAAVADRRTAAAGAYVEALRALGAESARAREGMSQGFLRNRALQRRAVLAGALILALAALGSALLAWSVAGSVTRPLVSLQRAALRIADGDLTTEVEVGSVDEVGQLAGSFGRMTGRLREIVTTLQGASGELAAAAAELGGSTQAQVSIVERAAAGVSRTGATTRELERAAALAASRAASVLDVARRAADVSDSGQAAAEESAEGIRQMQAAVDRIGGESARLFDHARHVGDIVGTVRDLAAQSHVLSLNASIEAARAGQAGKGFGVVAAEVRALAEQSRRSADRIAHVVKDIHEAIVATVAQTSAGARGMETSAARIRASGESLRALGAIVRETGDAARDIAGAVDQQSSGVARIATAVREIDEGMAETVTRLDDVQASADRVSRTARRIAGIAAEFRV